MSSTNNFWTYFGKFSAVVTVIGVIVTVFIAVTPHKASLHMSGVLSEFALPSGYSITAPNEKNVRFDRYFTAEIINSGSKPAEEVQIKLDGSGIYQVKNAQDSKAKSFKNSFTIGNISPNETVQVVFWGKNTYGLHWEKDIILAHKEGAGTTGIVGLITDRSTFQRFLLILLGLFCAVVLFTTLWLIVALQLGQKVKLFNGRTIGTIQ